LVSIDWGIILLLFGLTCEKFLLFKFCPWVITVFTKVWTVIFDLLLSIYFCLFSIGGTCSVIEDSTYLEFWLNLLDAYDLIINLLAPKFSCEIAWVNLLSSAGWVASFEYFDVDIKSEFVVIGFTTFVGFWIGNEFIK